MTYAPFKFYFLTFPMSRNAASRREKALAPEWREYQEPHTASQHPKTTEQRRILLRKMVRIW